MRSNPFYFRVPFRPFPALAVLSLAVVLAGCSKSENATIKGKVTMDGEPIAEGSIDLIPADGKTASAGALITNGEYSTPLYAGPKKVAINALKVVGEKPAYGNDPNGPKTQIKKQIVPAQYNEKTTLTLDVTEGENEKNFDLKSKE